MDNVQTGTSRTEVSDSLIDRLTDEYLERLRRGEQPLAEEYIARHPELADEIRATFPALAVMERAMESVPDTSGISPHESTAPSAIGDFRIIREVGRGGMGVVYEAEQVSLGRRVALKVLPKQSLLDPKHKQRFLREAKAAARLHHTNIVPVFGVGQQDGLHYYVMQFIHGLGLDEVLVELQRLREEGPETGEQGIVVSLVCDVSAVAVAQSLVSGRFERTLLVDSDEGDHPSALSNQPTATTPGSRSTLNHNPSTPAHLDTAVGRLSDTLHASGAFPLESTTHSRHVYWQSVARIGLQAAQALQYAHGQGIIHRDVKPGNLLLDTAGSVWVTDFGLAKAADQQDLTHTGDVLGTLRYMAPEQFEGAADARSDVFSLGLTLYELLALKPAFNERDRHKLIKQVTTGAPPRLRTLDPHIPRDLETIVHKAIDRDPSHRYQTAGELAADLQRYLGDEPIRARWISPVTRFARWCKRNPLVAGLTTTIVFLLAIAAVVSSIAAVEFRDLAGRNARLLVEKTGLANDRQDALNEAQSNLTRALDQERRATENLALAETEQERAEENLDLALAALDAVYLDAIATETLLKDAESDTSFVDASFSPSVRPPLTDLEKELIRRGLVFYDRFAQQNAATPRAAVQTAQAYYRIAVLQAALGDRSAAETAFQETIERFEQLTQDQPENGALWRDLGRARLNAVHVESSPERCLPLLQEALEAASNAVELLPEEADVYLLRVDIRIRLAQDVSSVLDDLETAVEFDDENASLHLAVACRLSNSPPYTEKPLALRHAERAIELAPHDPGGYICAGRTAVRMGEVQKGLDYLTDALELDPDNVAARLSRARSYAESGRDALAREDLRAVEGRMPRDGNAFRSRAETYICLGEFQKAIDDMLVVEEFAPDMNRYFVTLGTAYLGLGDYEQALETLNACIDRRPEWTIYKRRAEAHFHLGQFEEALADLQTAFQQRPQDLSTLVWIGAQNIAGCPDEPFRQGVLELMAEAIEHPETDHARAHSQRARLLEAMGRLDEATADFTAATELAPSDAHRWNNRGMFYHRIGDYTSARDDYSQAIQLDGEVPAFWANRALSHLNLQDHEQAVNDASQAIDLQEDFALAHKWRVQACTALKRWPEAIEDYTRLMELEPNHTEHLLGRGRARLASGDEAGAQADFNAWLQPFSLAVDENADNWEAWNRRGVAFSKLERWEAAHADFDMAAELAHGQSVIHQNRAACLREQARWADMADALATVVEQNAGNWRTEYELALASLASGDADRYRAACRRMLNIDHDAQDALSATFTVWTCVLARNSVDDYAPALALARSHVNEANANNARKNLGALLYRATRFDEALQQLSAVADETNGGNSSPAYTWYFLAMTHHALGHADDAMEWLAKANEWTEQVLTNADNPPLWNRKLTLELLRDEANSLIETDGSDDTPGQNGEEELPPAPPSAQRNEMEDQ